MDWAVRTIPAARSRFTFFPSMGEYPVYDDGVYDAFAVTDDRTRGYAEAIRAAAPGKVVLDIGTGRDALWAIAAARAGARHVYAVEAHPTAAAQATETVARAGLSGSVTVLHGDSADVRPAHPAEVCVSEIVGNIASSEGAIAVLADVRERWCAPGCEWIPFRMQTWAAAVDLSGSGAPVLAAESLPYLHAVFAAAGGPFDLRLCLAGPVAETIVSSAALVESVVFDGRRPAPELDAWAEAELRIEVPGSRPTGLLLWARVAPSARGPEIDTLTGDGRGWAPVYVPVPGLGGGDVIHLGFGRRTSDDGRHPDYTVTVDGAVGWAGPHHGGGFRGTAFYRELFSSPAPAGP